MQEKMRGEKGNRAWPFGRSFEKSFSGSLLWLQYNKKEGS